MKTLELPQFARELVMVVTEFDRAEAEQFLTPSELSYVASFASERRRHEWVGSRIAARSLAIRRGVARAPDELQIASELRPPVARAATHDLFVSFSHSHRAGAAALSPRRVGVDIERIRKIEPRLTKFFLHAEESSQAERLTIANSLIHLWAAKEAAFKLVASLTLLKDVRLVDWNSADDGLLLQFESGGVRGTVRTGVTEDHFVLALAQAD